MAESDRVAGIYSEIQYRFDPKSIKNLRKFKRDLMQVKENLRDIKRLTKGRLNIGIDSKQAKVSQQVQKASKKVTENNLEGAKALGKQNKLRESSLKTQIRQSRVSENSRKKDMAMEAKMAAQRAKLNRMGGAGIERGRITHTSLNRIRQAQERLNESYRRGSISVSQFNTQSQRLTGILQRQTSAAQKSTMSLNQMRTALASATGAYSAFAGAAGIKDIGGQFEDAGIMLETALGDEAAGTMQFLIEQSKRLGIGATETAKGFARYSLAGKQLGFTTQELQEQFLGIAEAATVFGLRQDEITGTIRALEQIMSKNQVNTMA